MFQTCSCKITNINNNSQIIPNISKSLRPILCDAYLSPCHMTHQDIRSMIIKAMPGVCRVGQLGPGDQRFGGRVADSRILRIFSGGLGGRLADIHDAPFQGAPFRGRETPNTKGFECFFSKAASFWACLDRDAQYILKIFLL